MEVATLSMPQRKPAKPARGRLARTSGNANRRKQAQKQVSRWAHRYTYSAVVLSSVLNGFAAVQHNSEGSLFRQTAAAGVSALVPVLVWGLAQLAGWLVRAGQHRLAIASGIVGIGMLFLSVFHVSESISILTGNGIVLSALLAVGIDCGLVTSELSAIAVSETE